MRPKCCSCLLRYLSIHPLCKHIWRKLFVCIPGGPELTWFHVLMHFICHIYFQQGFCSMCIPVRVASLVQLGSWIIFDVRLGRNIILLNLLFLLLNMFFQVFEVLFKVRVLAVDAL